MKPIDPLLLALHTHWVRADSIKERVHLDIVENGDELPKPMEELGQQWSKVHALEVLYGLIFVVIEGFQELGRKDERVEKLLAAEDFVDLLRRFRNWPAPGSADTELGVLMEPEVCHGETEVYPRVQA